MIDWILKNWFYSIPIGIAVVWIGCYMAEDKICQQKGLKGEQRPQKTLYPKTVMLAQALSVFLFLLWYNCGAIFWRMGWRFYLFLGFLLSLFLVMLSLRNAYQRVVGVGRRRGTVRPKSVAKRFWLRRSVGSMIPAWFLGLFPAAFLQSVGLKGLEGAIHGLFATLMPGLLPLLLLLAIWLLSGQHRAIVSGTYVPPKEEESDKKKDGPSWADIFYEGQMRELIIRGIEEEERENERKYREYWEDKYRK